MRFYVTDKSGFDLGIGLLKYIEGCLQLEREMLRCVWQEPARSPVTISLIQIYESVDDGRAFIQMTANVNTA